MIFRPELVHQIRAGRKTQTRRPTRAGEPCRYKAGKSYAVQPGRGKASTCRIHVTAVRQERVGDIAFMDARAEGFPTTDDFKAYWVAIHDAKWLERETTMLDEAENDDGVTLDRDVWLTRRSLDRFELHARKPVWVIRFHLDTTSAGRFLALRSDEIYTSNPARAMPDEPEAVDADTQRQITLQAGTVQRQWGSIEQARRDQDRALLSREEQITRLRRASRLRSIDASRELWALQNMLSSASDDRFIAKVRKTEARVFQKAA